MGSQVGLEMVRVEMGGVVGLVQVAGLSVVSEGGLRGGGGGGAGGGPFLGYLDL